ncbi:hypothetical protein IPJ70_03415 [Candidatus Campbellbacteria bacterium]|nr:MAG: hypothetical protein IPJ70_03415 [Candidatus Campbellbacteria bacterium]
MKQGTFAWLRNRVVVSSATLVLSIVALFISVYVVGWDTVFGSLWVMVPSACALSLAVALYCLWRWVSANDAWYASQQCRHLTRLKIMNTWTGAEREVLLCLMCVPTIGLRTQFSEEDLDKAGVLFAKSGNLQEFLGSVEALVKKRVINENEGLFFFGADFLDTVPRPPDQLRVNSLRSF